MGPDLETVLHLLTALLNLAVAVLTGASVSSLWLGRGTSAWAEARRLQVRHIAGASVLVALAADLMLLWLESAAMAELPVTAAGEATWSMLSATHLGLAWSIGMAGLVLAAAGVFVRGGRHPWPALPTLAGLAVFWYTRSMVSHAASDGDLSLRLLADWVHLGLASLWAGEVMLAGYLLPDRNANIDAAGRRARAAYVASLSSSATLALAGIVATGFYASWRALGGLEDFVGTRYGNTLLAKLLCVGLAVLLGGYNRFVVMPPWLARESGGKPAPAVLPRRFRRILRIEGFVLLAALMAAAWLAATSPPGEQM